MESPLGGFPLFYRLIGASKCPDGISGAPKATRGPTGVGVDLYDSERVQLLTAVV